jgi:hypothetical protein
VFCFELTERKEIIFRQGCVDLRKRSIISSDIGEFLFGFSQPLVTAQIEDYSNAISSGISDELLFVCRVSFHQGKVTIQAGEMKVKAASTEVI